MWLSLVCMSQQRALVAREANGILGALGGVWLLG